MVELLTAVLFSVIYIKYGWSFETLAGCLLTAILITSSFIDIDTGYIPDIITYPGMLAGVMVGYFTIGFISALYGMLAFAAVYLSILLVSRGGLGGGDVKLAGVIGAFTGLEGALLTFILSSLLGGLWAGVLITKGKAQMKTEIRFGPFLAIAGYIVCVWGQDLLFYYLRLF